MIRLKFSLLLLLFCGNTYSQNVRKLFIDALYHLEYKNYNQALPPLLSIDSAVKENSNIKYRIGLCYVNSTANQSKAIPFLLYAVKNIATGNYDDLSFTEDKAPLDAYFWLGRAYHLNYEFDQAIANYETYKANLSYMHIMAQEADRMIEQCRFAKDQMRKPRKVTITNLGEGINTEYEELCPVVTADQSILIFTSGRPGTTGDMVDIKGEFLHDIYVSKMMEGKGNWSAPEKISTNINTAAHDVAISLSADGQRLFIYKDDNGDGNIYHSFLIGNDWTVPEMVSGSVNSKSWEPHASITADGSTLYFVSDRSGGLGGRDIYTCKMLPNGEWSEAKNLGPTVNTKYDEDAPFIHPDGTTLYFCSNGLEGMGGFDIFSAELQPNGSWSVPKNMKYPVNTPHDDVFFVLMADGVNAYFSSVRKEGFGGQDIYRAQFKDIAEKPLTVLKGVMAVKDEQGNNLDAFIYVKDKKNDETTIYKPNKETGKYLFILEAGNSYSVNFEIDEFVIYNEVFNIPLKSSYAEIEKAITLKPLALTMEKDKKKKVAVGEMREGSKIILENIYFESDKTELNPESKKELDSLYRMIADKKELLIEISGHTDSKGFSVDNVQLSQMRAEAVVKYLAAKGIAKSRLVAQGYGSIRSIAPNANPDGTDNPEGRAKNRRIELKILEIQK